MMRITLAILIAIVTVCGSAVFMMAHAQSGTIDQIVTAVCGDNGALLRWIIGILATSVGANIAANFKFVHNTPFVGAIVRFVGANWATWLRQAIANSASKPASL